jgi:carboxymethylenebutenolidase
LISRPGALARVDTFSCASYHDHVPELAIRGAGTTDLHAYLAEPDVGDGPWPGVVVIHDVLGLTDVTRLHADRLATAGYLAIAPDLYSRGGIVRCMVATFRSVTRGEGRAYEDIETCRRWLVGREDCTKRIGVIGFCMGGGFALMTAARGFQASAANYGILPRDVADLSGACPIVASYGAKDRNLGRAGQQLEETLVSLNIPHDVKTYPNVAHSFLDRYNLGPLTPVARVAGFGYDHGTAEDAWARILRFFARYIAVT